MVLRNRALRLSIALVVWITRRIAGEHSAILTAALARRLTRAGMRQSACMRLTAFSGAVF
jgi:hypothetical protein